MAEAATIELPGLITGTQAKSIADKLLTKRATRKLIDILGFPSKRIRIRKIAPDWNRIYKEIEEKQGSTPTYWTGKNFLDAVESYAKLPSLGIITNESIMIHKELHRQTYSNPNIDQIFEESWRLLTEESAEIDFSNRKENLKYLRNFGGSNAIILSIGKEDYLFKPEKFIDGMGTRDSFGTLEKYTGQLEESKAA